MLRGVDLDKLENSEFLTDDAKYIMRERAMLWIRAEQDEKGQAGILKMCREGTDFFPPYLFFARYFAWIFEPRNPFGFKKLPFVPFKYQERELAVIHAAVEAGEGVLGKKQIKLWLKSRDMGLTWIFVLYFAWHALFRAGHFHCGSRNESEVDTKGDVKCIFFKIRYLINNLPQWMIEACAPDKDDKHLLVAWNNGESGISGETANPEFGSGNRQSAVLLDEYSKWEHDRLAYRSVYGVTNVIFLNGTPYGYGNYYSEIACGKTKINVDVRRVHWTDHPLKARGLAYVNGKATSPWYQEQVEAAEADIVAGELDLSFEGSRKGIIFGDVYGVQHQKRGMKPIPGVPVVRCWDPGGWAAVIWIQVDKWRRVHVFRELVTEGVSLLPFAEQVMSISNEFEAIGCRVYDHNGNIIKINDPRDWFTWEDAGDPSGASTSKMNQEVPEYTTLYEKHGINVEFMHVANMPTDIRRRARILAIQNAMAHPVLASEGNPGFGFWIDVDECPILDEALRGGYQYKLDNENRVTNAIAERHPYNEVIDALGYGVLYKLGIPEQIKREQRQRSEEQKEDEEEEEQGSSRRSRC